MDILLVYLLLFCLAISVLMIPQVSLSGPQNHRYHKMVNCSNMVKASDAGSFQQVAQPGANPTLPECIEQEGTIHHCHILLISSFSS